MARWFSFLDRFRKEKEVEQPTSSQIKVEIQKVREGVIIRLQKSGEQASLTLPLSLPLEQLQQQASSELLEALDELWYEEILQNQGDHYLLPYPQFLQLSPEVKRMFSIPQKAVKLQLRLSHEGAIGTGHFRFVLEKHLNNWKHVERTAKQTGPWIRLPDQSEWLMDPDQYELEQLLDRMPDPKDAEQIFSFVAQVRHLAKRMNIPLDDYLKKQEYLFVDQLELDLDYNGEEIQLSPRYQSSDPIPSDLLNEMSRSASHYARGKNHEKVFVKPEIQQRAAKIRQADAIRGADIPRFLENPEAFIPEELEIDLSLFSERVKSLGIQVYRSQPYVHAREKDRGWFDLDIGFRVLDENGEGSRIFQPEEMRQLIERAQQKGEEYIEWNGHWLKIPQDALSFTEATERLKQEIGDNQKVDLSKLPYVLEIYENINQLEFNQPILDVHKEMQDAGLLDPVPPKAFLATLKPFQTNGFLWMKSLYYQRLGGLLADDMGLGKTIQVISFLSYLQDIGQLTPTLLVVPKTLLENWIKEMRQFAPLLLSSIHIHQGPSRTKHPELLQNIGITLTTYQTLVRDQLTLGQVDWKAVICDEAQAIKNPTTAAAHVVKALKSRFRLAMTGTPVENSLSELWSIMDFVQPGLLGSLSEFKQEFILPMEENGQSDFNIDIEQKLLQRMVRVYKRRTKSEELAGQLPKKQMIIKEVPFGKVQKQLYQDILTLVSEKMMSGLEAIQKLKAIAAHPALYSEKYDTLPSQEVPKLMNTLEIVEEIRCCGEKVLIFTEFIRMQKILQQTIRDHFGINPMIINGMTSRRQEYVDWFNQRPGFDVMILSPKAAGTGLTITSANHVIHYTRWWNPAVENQATDRVYRIGQEKDVFVYYPIVCDAEGMLPNGTVEQIVHRILMEKQDLASSVIVSNKKIGIEEEILSQVGTMVH